MPFTNGRAFINFKINDYLKFNFFNGWNEPLTEQLEKNWNVPSHIGGKIKLCDIPNIFLQQLLHNFGSYIY